MPRVEWIFHEAAIPSIPLSVEDPVASNHAGVSGAVQLLVEARDARCPGSCMPVLRPCVTTLPYCRNAKT